MVLLSTHIVSDIEYIANEIWLMKDGKLVQSGTSKETDSVNAGIGMAGGCR